MQDKEHMKYSNETMDAAWGKMAAILDQQMPVQSKKRRYLWLLLLLFLVIGVGGFVLYASNLRIDGTDQKAPVEEEIAQATDETFMEPEVVDEKNWTTHTSNFENVTAPIKVNKAPTVSVPSNEPIAAAIQQELSQKIVKISDEPVQQTRLEAVVLIQTITPELFPLEREEEALHADKIRSIPVSNKIIRLSTGFSPSVGLDVFDGSIGILRKRTSAAQWTMAYTLGISQQKFNLGAVIENSTDAEDFMTSIPPVGTGSVQEAELILNRTIRNTYAFAGVGIQRNIARRWSLFTTIRINYLIQSSSLKSNANFGLNANEAAMIDRTDELTNIINFDPVEYAFVTDNSVSEPIISFNRIMPSIQAGVKFQMTPRWGIDVHTHINAGHLNVEADPTFQISVPSYRIGVGYKF